MWNAAISQILALLHVITAVLPSVHGIFVNHEIWQRDTWHTNTSSHCRIFHSVFHTLSLQEVKIVNCSYQQLSEIPENLPEDIEVLILEHNQIILESNLDLPYHQLKALMLAENDIQNVPAHAFRSFKNLEILDLFSEASSIQSVSSQSFEGLQKLQYLKLSVLDLDGKSLFVRGQDTHLTALADLHLITAGTVIPGDCLKGISLNTLHFQADLASDVPETLLQSLGDDRELRLLSLSFKNASSLPATLIQGFSSSLEALHLEVGGLLMLPDAFFSGYECADPDSEEASGEDMTFFSFLGEILEEPEEVDRSCLKAILLSGVPQIQTQLLRGLKQLAVLSLRGTQVIEEASFDDLYHLEELRITESSLKSLPIDLLEKLHYLKHVKISHTSLSYIDEDFFINQDAVQHLDLSHNKLLELDEYLFWSVRTEIRYLDISHNDICELAEYLFSYMNSLVVLDLTDNCIATLEPTIFEELIELRQLNIGKNSIAELPIGLFDNLHNVMWINLAYNKLSEISDDMWFNNVMLQELDLTYNLLQSEPHFDFGEKTTVLLFGNPYLLVVITPTPASPSQTTEQDTILEIPAPPSTTTVTLDVTTPSEEDSAMVDEQLLPTTTTPTATSTLTAAVPTTPASTAGTTVASQEQAGSVASPHNTTYSSHQVQVVLHDLINDLDLTIHNMSSLLQEPPDSHLPNDLDLTIHNMSSLLQEPPDSHLPNDLDLTIHNMSSLLQEPPDSHLPNSISQQHRNTNVHVSEGQSLLTLDIAGDEDSASHPAEENKVGSEHLYSAQVGAVAGELGDEESFARTVWFKLVVGCGVLAVVGAVLLAVFCVLRVRRARRSGTYSVALASLEEIHTASKGVNTDMNALPYPTHNHTTTVASQM